MGRRACLNMLAWSLTTEDRTRLRNSFVELDKNGDGSISLGEMKKALEDNFDIETEEVKEVFTKLDACSEEEINYSDFLAAVLQDNIHMHEAALRAAFSRFDENNSGFVTLQDLQLRLGITFNETEKAELMRRVDPGNTGNISLEGFMAYLNQQAAAHRRACPDWLL